MRTQALILLFLMTISLSLAAADAPDGAPATETPEAEPDVSKKLYKSYDEYGNPVYTDIKPMPNGEDEVEVLDDKFEQLNVLEPKSTERKRYESEILKEQKRREASKAGSRKAQEKARQALEQAKAALEAGKEPTDEDWQRTVNGRRFLKQSYFDRQERLAREVEEAEETLKALQ